MRGTCHGFTKALESNLKNKTQSRNEAVAYTEKGRPREEIGPGVVAQGEN